jgi:D-3-phosphoglycerate dehydrogenase
MSEPRLLFTAPHTFLPKTDALFRGFDPVFMEAWSVDALPPTDRIEYWIPNPGQHFAIDSDVLTRFPSLVAISTPSTGTNHIDRASCRKRGVRVYSLLDDRSALEEISASAEFTFLHVLNALRRIDVAIEAVRAGGWRDDEDRFRGRELQGLRVGLVGIGRIGTRLARYFDAFGCTVSAHDPHGDCPDGVRPVPSLNDLFGDSDVLVVCCSLTEETAGMIGAGHMRALPQGAIFVNTARGEVLQEDEVAGVLEDRRDLVLAVDVISGEVDGSFPESPLFEAALSGKALVTPHIAGATTESQLKAAQAAIRLLREYHLA